jgi:hypothetical protein
MITAKRFAGKADCGVEPFAGNFLVGRIRPCEPPPTGGYRAGLRHRQPALRNWFRSGCGGLLQRCFANSRRPWDERAALAHRCNSEGRPDGQGVGKQGRAQTLRDVYGEGSQFSRIGRMRQEVGESLGRGSAVAAGGGPEARAGCRAGYGSAARCDCGRRGSVGLGGGERFRCGRPGALASLFSVKRWAFSGGLLGVPSTGLEPGPDQGLWMGLGWPGGMQLPTDGHEPGPG